MQVAPFNVFVAPLQAFGLAVLMAKAGLPVPAAAPVRLAPFSGVLADIGDEQSLAANLSTFSGHLRRIQVCRVDYVLGTKNVRRSQRSGATVAKLERSTPF